MKKVIIICLAAICVLCCKSHPAENSVAEADSLELKAPIKAKVDTTKKKTAKPMETIEEKIAKLPEEPVFLIETSLGDIKVKLYKNTPKHRENFERLALSGFYDSLLFHRVINGFMIQGGDPLTRDPENKDMFGTGGPDYTIQAEFRPEYRHKKGALAAARRGDMANPMKESSGSQFYIVQNEAACAQLDGEYTVYGQTIDGFDVIDKIAAVGRDRRDCPINPVYIKKIKLSK